MSIKIGTKEVTVFIILFIVTIIMVLFIKTPVAVNASNNSDRVALGTENLLNTQINGQQYWSIAGSTFTNLFSYVGHAYDSGGCLYFIDGSANSTYANASVNIPPGSIINSIRVYYYDNTPDSNITLVLRENSFEKSYDDLVTFNPTGVPGLIYDEVTGLNISPDYSNHTYTLQYFANYIGFNLELCAVRIGYIPPSIFGSALPQIQK